MTLFNQIGESGLGELLTRRLTTPGGSNSPTVAPEIFPVFVVEGERPELDRLKGVFLCGGRVPTVAAAPALRSICLFENPASSGIIATITRIDAIPAAGDIDLIVRNFVTGIAAVTTPGVRDVKAGVPVQLPVCTLATDNTSGVPATGLTQRIIGRIYTALVTGFTEPIVIRPGCGLWIGPSTDNTALTGAQLQWYERKAQPGELA